MGEFVEEPKFEVVVSGTGSSLEDWRRAQKVPRSELPELSPDEKEVARKFGITEEEYARSSLSLSYGHERRRSRGIDLGRAVEQILRTLGADYRLAAVISEMSKLRWVVRIQIADQIVNVAIPFELADDLLDSDTVQDRDRLETLLRSSLERHQAIGKRELR